MSSRAQSSVTSAERLHAGVERASARHEELDAVPVGERRNRVHPLALKLQALAAGDQNRGSGDVAEARDLTGRVRQQMLRVVEEQQRTPPADARCDGGGEVHPGALLDPERLRHGGDHVAGGPQRCERDPPDTVRVGLRSLAGGLEREPRLACPPGTGEREEPDSLGGLELGDELGELALATEERASRARGGSSR